MSFSVFSNAVFEKKTNFWKKEVPQGNLYSLLFTYGHPKPMVKIM